ncbi:methyltransferase domain-containing protein [Leisingera sp. SS27]|uniref:class I SAM-dependent methyltransferase n=1 Tax=Leisingera sp. SS27 TaxID=2979462 RepID=UPI00232B4CCA|nr:class I SAM-dependent methyltransferase [Leisingera sp. SS27]MDC0659459.1 methyltransferase domain-containing protein [Leisingera sp. SS27]
MKFDPRRLAAVARAGGSAAPDPMEPFTYADFGCGYGLTVIMLAQALPHGQFFGIDLMPEHMEAAQAYASQLGVKNVTFIASAFDEIQAHALPPLDFAVAHGILSWVAPEVRRSLRRIVSSSLKPDGLFAASYNLGSSERLSIPQVRSLMVEAIARGVPEDTALQQGVEMMQYAHGGAAGQFLGAGESDQLAYLRHEYLSQNWTCFSHLQVASEMAEDGLMFRGPYLSDACLVPVGERALPIADPLYWEDVNALREKNTFALSLFSRMDAGESGPQPAKQMPSGYLTLLPSVANLLVGEGFHPVFDAMGKSSAPHPGIPLSEIGRRAADAYSQNALARMLHNSSFVAFSNKPFQPSVGAGQRAFVLSDEVREQIARHDSILPVNRTLICPGTQTVISPLHDLPWLVLTHCSDVPVDHYAEVLLQLPGIRSMLAHPTYTSRDGLSSLLHAWHSRWAPWLAAQGVLALK